jgi:hypothetical protein
MWKVSLLSMLCVTAFAPVAMARRPCNGTAAAPQAAQQAPADQGQNAQAQRPQSNRSYSYEPEGQRFVNPQPRYGSGSRRSSRGWHAAGFKALGRYSF